MSAEKERLGRVVSLALDGITVEPRRRSEGPDLVIRTPDGRSVVIEAKWAGEGWPQDVRRAAAEVPDPWPPNVVLLAHQLSPGAIEWLRERGANWADEAGQARILGPAGLVVIREPSRPRVQKPAPRGFHWSPSAITIAEVILSREDRPWRATELAERSGWSLPQTANVLKAFDDQGWTIKRGTARGPGSHRDLIDVDELLASWSNAVTTQPRVTRRAHRATQDVMGMLRESIAPALDQSVPWAVSGWAALELAAPCATTTPSLHIYVAEDDFAGALSGAIDRSGLREVDEGGRVTFWAADRRVLGLASRHDDLRLASAPRIYADLAGFGARGQDAADHIRQQLIDPLHPPSPATGDGRERAGG